MVANDRDSTQPSTIARAVQHPCALCFEECGPGCPCPCHHDTEIAEAVAGLVTRGLIRLDYDDVDDATRVALTPRGRAEVAS